jgi:hypothetical protein
VQQIDETGDNKDKREIAIAPALYLSNSYQYSKHFTHSAQFARLILLGAIAHSVLRKFALRNNQYSATQIAR